MNIHVATVPIVHELYGIICDYTCTGKYSCMYVLCMYVCMYVCMCL